MRHVRQVARDFVYHPAAVPDLTEAYGGEASHLPASSTATLDDLWQILWHGRMWIAITAAMLVAATLAYGVLTPPLYTAAAEILVDPRDRQVLSKDINPSAVAPDGGITQVDSQVRVVESSSVLLRAMAATHLSEDPEFSGKSFLSKLAGMIGLGSGAASAADASAADEDKTLANLKRRVAVKRADKVLVLDVLVTAQSPGKAALIANAIADAYLADQAAARRQAGQEASGELTARLAEQKQRVETAENRVEQYKAQKNMVTASGQLVSDQQLIELNTELSAARARSSALKAQIDQLAQLRREGSSSDSTAEAMQSNVVSKLREQESVLVQRVADLESQLGPRHPAIAAARLQLANVRQLIATELGRIVKSAKADYERATANERRLADRLDRLKAQNLAGRQDDVALRELERQRDAARSVYQDFLVRANETREQAGIDSTNARVITRATPPLNKSWPLMGVLLAGALGGGLGLGAFLALLREYIRPTVLSAAQAERALNVPVVGVLPGKSSKAPEAAKAFDAAAWLVLRRIFGHEAAQQGHYMRSLLVTAADADQAACSHIAFRLAEAAAYSGERVLFIDSAISEDPQNPRPGLLDVLRGERPLRQAIRLVRRSNLHVMEKGSDRDVPSERTLDEFLRRMLADAGRQFDLVVIDAGSLHGNVSMSALLGKVDAVAALVRPALTRQNDLVALNETARIMSRPISALILTEMKPV